MKKQTIQESIQSIKEYLVEFQPILNEAIKKYNPELHCDDLRLKELNLVGVDICNDKNEVVAMLYADDTQSLYDRVYDFGVAYKHGKESLYEEMIKEEQKIISLLDQNIKLMERLAIAEAAIEGSGKKTKRRM